MKTTLSLIFAVFALFAADDPALVGRWPLNDGTGTTIKDASTRKHDAHICNPASFAWVAGRDGGKALRIEKAAPGKSPFVAIEKVAAGDFSNGMTVMVWFQPDGDGAVGILRDSFHGSVHVICAVGVLVVEFGGRC